IESDLAAVGRPSWGTHHRHPAIRGPYGRRRGVSFSVARPDGPTAGAARGERDAVARRRDGRIHGPPLGGDPPSGLPVASGPGSDAPDVFAAFVIGVNQ